MTLKAEWIDGGREAQCVPDPAFPLGMDVDASNGANKTCSVNLPYPAPRCGNWVVNCDRCNLVIGLTAAGRVDDPRSITLGCFAQVINPNPPGTTKLVLPGSTEIKRTPYGEPA